MVTKVTKVTTQQIEQIGKKHSIHPQFWPELLLLANSARIENDEFAVRLHTAKNYQAACTDIMALLARRKKCCQMPISK